MGCFKTMDEALGFITQDRFAAGNGMHLDEYDDNGCVCSMEIREEHRNALDMVMGGVIYTLADMAFAVAANNDNYMSVALDSNVNFLSASKGSRLFAKATRIKSGRNTGVYQILVTDDLGKKVALVTETSMKVG